MNNVGKLFSASQTSTQKDEKRLGQDARAIWDSIRKGGTVRYRSPSPETNYTIPNHPEEYQKLWTENEAKWMEFASTHGNQISYDSIPFPPCDKDVLEFVMGNNSNRNSNAAFKRACMRYHPDKFMQQYGSFLVGSDSVRIIARLNAITQSINSEWHKSKTAARIRNQSRLNYSN